MNYWCVSVGLVILLPSMEKAYSCHRSEIPASSRGGSRQCSHSASPWLQCLPWGYLLLRHSVGLHLPTAAAAQQSPMHWLSSFYMERTNAFGTLTRAPLITHRGWAARCPALPLQISAASGAKRHSRAAELPSSPGPCISLHLLL